MPGYVIVEACDTAIRTSCRRATCLGLESRLVFSPPDGRRRVVRWRSHLRFAGMGGGGGVCRSGRAGWDTGDEHIPPGRTETSPARSRCDSSRLYRENLNRKVFLNFCSYGNKNSCIDKLGANNTASFIVSKLHFFNILCSPM